MSISEQLRTKLENLGKALVDQNRARIAVYPKESKRGFWFGGGNMAQDRDGTLYLVGRYRNHGDSRTGITAGERGMELAICRSKDQAQTFQQIASFMKEDLNTAGRKVISIEGSCLVFSGNKVKLFVSSEKTGKPYPSPFSEYQKPGTGIWTIDLLKADTIDGLKTSPVEIILESSEPMHLHIKDPEVISVGDRSVLLFANHPFTWASANSGYAVLHPVDDSIEETAYEFFPRGPSWDVAITRITGVLEVPHLGVFRELPTVLLYFYDGGESLREYEEYPQAIKRARGYSCEEIGGLAFGFEIDFPRVERVSKYRPLFVSPWGTRSSRYTKTLTTAEGIYAIWQQSREDFSQPLVMNFLSMEEVEEILA